MGHLKAKQTKGQTKSARWCNCIGQVTPVYCYTDGVEGELFVNGKSQGRIKKNPKERLDRYRLRWNDVKYEPGELKVVVYDEKGQPAGEQTVKTAGAAAKLQLDIWTQHSTHHTIPYHTKTSPIILSPISITHHPNAKGNSYPTPKTS